MADQEAKLTIAAERAYEALRRTMATPLHSPSWRDLDEQVRSAWVYAMRQAGPIEVTTVRMSVPMDLSETAFNHARAMMNGPLEADCVVIHGPAYLREAKDLRDKYGCVYVEVPAEMLPTPHAWAVVSPQGKVWSSGC